MTLNVIKVLIVITLGPLLHLGPKVITIRTFITFRVIYYIWGLNKLVLYFAIENKKYTEKRLSEYLYYSSRYFRCWKLLHLDHGGIFHCILNTSHNLLKNTRKRVWKNQPERREVHVRDERWQVKPSFHQSEKCFCKLLPTRKSYFLFWLKK